ncbi:O-antigen ligase family protein [Roseimaritima sediminicola]|uniref:O-antigen ligase family protein n=1 Tax=Roseimaritima sediminicola TaxID=2662066 RepID=UPI00129827F5|nr:O-antigen ligase family protein [Roseimaritima sediminicola]
MTSALPLARPRSGVSLRRQTAAPAATLVRFWLPLGVIAAVLIVVSGSPQWAAGGGAEITVGERVGATLSRQVAFLTLGAMGLLLWLLPTRPAQRPVWHILLPAAGLLAFVLSSTLWSEVPAMTFKRGIVVACITIAGFGLSRHWQPRAFCLAIILLSSLLLIVSIGVELRYRMFFSTPEEYRFSGIFHPAKQAFNCGMLALAALAAFLAQRRRRYLVLVALAVAFLLMTKARTGVGATVLAGGVLIWPHLTLRSVAVGSIVAGCLAGAALVTAGLRGATLPLEQVLTLGRDAELADPSKLTGRLPIWNQALQLYARRPLAGYGYGAFWTQQRLDEFERRNGWPLAHSHSAYIESLVNLGAVGVLGGLLLALGTLVRSLRLAALYRSPALRLVAALLTMALISGLTEMAFIGDGYEFLAITMAVGLIAFRPRDSGVRGDGVRGDGVRGDGVRDDGVPRRDGGPQTGAVA